MRSWNSEIAGVLDFCLDGSFIFVQAAVRRRELCSRLNQLFRYDREIDRRSIELALRETDEVLRDSKGGGRIGIGLESGGKSRSKTGT